MILLGYLTFPFQEGIGAGELKGKAQDRCVCKATSLCFGIDSGQWGMGGMGAGGTKVYKPRKTSIGMGGDGREEREEEGRRAPPM